MLSRFLIDSRAFAINKEWHEGQISLRDLDSRALLPDIQDISAIVSYTLCGGIDNWQRPYLDLSLSGSLKLNCQRCLGAMPFILKEAVRIVLFDTEAELDAAMLADDELDGMLAEQEFDVFSLLEDQILMALPFAPMHDVCDNAELITVNQNKPNPFAVLAGLKKSD